MLRSRALQMAEEFAAGRAHLQLDNDFHLLRDVVGMQPQPSRSQTCSHKYAVRCPLAAFVGFPAAPLFPWVNGRNRVAGPVSRVVTWTSLLLTPVEVMMRWHYKKKRNLKLILEEGVIKPVGATSVSQSSCLVFGECAMGSYYRDAPEALQLVPHDA